MNETTRCEERQPILDVGALATAGKEAHDPTMEKLRNAAIDNLNAYLIYLLDKKRFCLANRIGDVLRKLV